MPIALPILAEAEELGLGAIAGAVEGLRDGAAVGELVTAALGGSLIGAPAALIGALAGLARRRRRSFRPKFRVAPGGMPPPPVAPVGSSDACRESVFAPCGNDLATLGYRALAPYNGSSGTLTGLSENCLDLFVTLSPSARDADVVLPTVCGDDCLQFDGMEPMN